MPSLLFADDKALLAENAENMRRSLQCLQAWCERWSVEINVMKSAVIHNNNPYLLVLTETWLGLRESAFLPGYTWVGRNRT